MFVEQPLASPGSANNPVPVEETEPAENTEKKVNSIGSVEISITTWAEKVDEATKLEYSASDTKKFTFEKLLLLPYSWVIVKNKWWQNTANSYETWCKYFSSSPY